MSRRGVREAVAGCLEVVLTAGSVEARRDAEQEMKALEVTEGDPLQGVSEALTLILRVRARVGGAGSLGGGGRGLPAAGWSAATAVP